MSSSELQPKNTCTLASVVIIDVVRRRRLLSRCSRTQKDKKMRRSNKKNNKNNRKSRPPQPTSIGDDDGIASRTRRKMKALAAKWDLQTPIIIEIVGWLDQESLMNLSLVSKQLRNIIANEPGNENKIHPIFEVSGNSNERLFQNMHGYFLNMKTAKKLQRYHIMRFNDPSKFEIEIKPGDSTRELKQIVKNVQMNGITSLDLSSPFPSSYTNYKKILTITYTLAFFFPNLREVDFSNTGVDNVYLRRFSENCPLLEKVTAHNNDAGMINFCGYAMEASNNLKEIHMDNSNFDIWNTNEVSDLSNHQDIFMFHLCCKALERVSIRNVKYRYGFIGDEDQKLIFTQNALIKFVRNAPPTLHWLRSDLTPDNMTMLRMERPGIELLN
jgi:hypothetical protein